MRDRELMFFAYQGRRSGQADENVDAILNAIAEFNGHQKGIEAKSWEDYKSTAPINIDILSAIDKCEYFVCDLSYFNHNVLFELGYALAKDRKILIFLNERVSGAKERYDQFLLKSIRYSSLTNSTDILAGLQQHRAQNGLLRKFINVDNLVADSSDLFYIQSAVKTEASLEISERISFLRNNDKWAVIEDDSHEVAYRPLNWYFQSIVKAKSLLVHLIGKDLEGAVTENARNSFFAGVGCGLGKRVLLVAPAIFKAPLDYHDIVIQFRDIVDLLGSIEAWLSKCERVAAHATHDHGTDLLRLGIGYEVAEEEKDNLPYYFVETASYLNALRRKQCILTGRKGSGKSAIYIQLQEELKKDKANYVLSLRPEPDELLQDLALSSSFAESGRRSFFISLWKLIVCSKLIYACYERLMERQSAGFTPVEDELIQFVESNGALIQKNVIGILRILKERGAGGKLTGPQLLEDLFRSYLGPLIRCLRHYFESLGSKYIRVIVLADNLDQTWDKRNDLASQADLITSLFDLESRIGVEFKGSSQIEVRQILFLRDDIFQFILRNALEPDKLIAMSHEINWENYPNLLRKVIENRFKYILGLENDFAVSKVWGEFFDLGSRDPFEIIEPMVTKRPRDIIYFLGRLFDSAIDKGHVKVNESDLEYAIVAYSKFLNNNVIAETKAEFPEIGEIIRDLHEYLGQKIEYKNYYAILLKHLKIKARVNALTDAFFKSRYLAGINTETRQPFSDMDTLETLLRKRRWWYFARNKVYLIPHAKAWFVKNRKASFV